MKKAPNPRSISWRCWQVNNLENCTFLGSCIQKSFGGLFGPHFGDRLQEKCVSWETQKIWGDSRKRCIGWSERYNREREREHEWGKEGRKDPPKLPFLFAFQEGTSMRTESRSHRSCRTPVRCWGRLRSQRFAFVKWSTLWPLLLGMRWLRPLVGTPTRSGPWTVIKVLTLAVHRPDPDGPVQAHKRYQWYSIKIIIGSKRIQREYTGPDRGQRLLARSKHKTFVWVFAKVVSGKHASRQPLGWCHMLLSAAQFGGLGTKQFVSL